MRVVKDYHLSYSWIFIETKEKDRHAENKETIPIRLNSITSYPYRSYTQYSSKYPHYPVGTIHEVHLKQSGDGYLLNFEHKDELDEFVETLREWTS